MLLSFSYFFNVRAAKSLNNKFSLLLVLVVDEAKFKYNYWIDFIFGMTNDEVYHYFLCKRRSAIVTGSRISP